ncbi:MAG TPA: MFS transporter [Planctomycetota bacterium]
MKADRRGLLAGCAAMALVGAATFLGSENLKHYDPILLTYTFGTLFAAFGIAYRVTVWLRRPPTRVYLRRGLRLMLKGRHAVKAAKAAVVDMAAQRFIARRSRLRWFIHFNLAWGTMLAIAVTFPLVFGWLHFETPTGDHQNRYQVVFLSLTVMEFKLDSPIRFLIFNALNISAIMVTLGAILSIHRRLGSEAATARQQFGNDLLPLVILLAISLTGLLLTFSTHVLEGAGYQALSLIHALTVCLGMVYVPFGKFFHIFQRPAQLGVVMYREENRTGPQAACRACGESFAGALHVADLKGVLAETGVPLGAHLDLCPRCKRRNVAALAAGLRHAEAASAAQAGAAR